MANETIPFLLADLSPAPILAVTLAVSCLLFALIWGVHVKKEDAGVVDFFWGSAFVITGAIALALSWPHPARTALPLALTVVWAVRMTVYMIRRHAFQTGEDARYRAIRARGGPSYWWTSLFSVFLVQAIVQWLIALPLVLVAILPAAEPVIALLAAGLTLFTAGLVLQTVSERHLLAFRSQHENRARLCTDGPFSLCRHPNYLGEIMVWTGIALVAGGMTGSVLPLIGPAVLTLLLVKVSGIPPLEAHLASTRPGFSAWAAETPALIPRLFGRRSQRGASG